MALVSSSVGILSTWFRVDDDSQYRHLLFAGNNDFPPYDFFVAYTGIEPLFFTTGNMTIGFDNSGPGGSFQVESLTSFPSATTSELHHLLVSWDLSGVPIVQLYIDDVNDANIIFSNTGTLPWNLFVECTIFSQQPHNDNFWNGCCSSLYLNTQEYLDFSIVANRRKFISAALEPVDLGTNGELPTGNSPSFYHYGGPSNFPTNYGTEGQPTLVGSFIDCPDIIPPGCCTWFFSDEFLSS